MKKSIKIFFYITITLLLLIIIAVFFLRNYVEISSVLPPRPDSIPVSALWVGGPDGGVYIYIKNNNEDIPDIYDAEIYNSSGSINYKGKLTINSSDNPQFNYNDVNSYSGWDGDTLYLQDGRLLKIFSE